MKNWHKIIFLLFLFLFVSFPGVVSSLEPSDLPKRLIVKFKPEIPENIEQTELVKLKLLTEKTHLIHTYVLTTSAKNIGETLKNLAATKKIEYIETDYIAQALEIPNDTYFNKEWGLTKIAVPGAWSVTHGKDVKIAIIDTGIANHPDVQSKIVARKNFTTDADTDGNGHGTHVAGIAGAVTNNSVGVAGVGYESSLISVKVLSNTGQGYYSWIASGIVWAADNGADVINLSLGGSYDSKTINDAISYAWNKGVVVVAASGNSGTTTPVYPAYYDTVIAVAATDNKDQKAWFSNYGNWVDVAAPGVSILSTYKGDYALESGTSMASPFVSGVAALIKSAHPQWSNSDIRNKLEQSTDKIAQTGSYWIWGRVNACRAVDCVEVVSSPVPLASPVLFTSPSPSPSSLPSSLPSVFITYLTITKTWDTTLTRGNIVSALNFKLYNGNASHLRVKLIPDTSGEWNLRTDKTTITVYINQNKYQTELKWDTVSKNTSIDIESIGTIHFGDIVKIEDLWLTNTNRGSHNLKFQIWEGENLLKERTVGFRL